MHLNKSCLITLWLACVPFSAHAALPEAQSVPGGIAIIQLENAITHKQKPQAWFDKQPVLIQKELKQWYAVIGLPLSTPPGWHKLNVKLGNKTRMVDFRVRKKKYPEQHITLKDNSKVELSPENETRAVGEIAQIKQLKHQWSEDDNTDLGFVAPAEGPRSGNFGLKRFFNGKPRSPHAGLDIVVPRGTPIHAASAGTVLNVHDYFFNGNTIFIDHGNGLITMYCHMDQMDVKAGDHVEKGQAIGLSGMTGRATGPHLHWSVILNGAMVNPALFIQKEIGKNGAIN